MACAEGFFELVGSDWLIGAGADPGLGDFSEALFLETLDDIIKSEFLDHIEDFGDHGGVGWIGEECREGIGVWGAVGGVLLSSWEDFSQAIFDHIFKIHGVDPLSSGAGGTGGCVDIRREPGLW